MAGDSPTRHKKVALDSARLPKWGPPSLLLLATALAPIAAPRPSEGLPAPELELSWVAPPPCPDDNGVHVRIEQLLRRPLGSAGDLGTLHVQAAARAEGDGWSLELTIGADGGGRTRTLTGPSCDTLAETVALLTAISLDPGVDPSTPPPPVIPSDPKPPRQPEPPRQPAPRPKVQPEPIDEPPPTAPSDPRYRAAVLVGGAGALGVTPAVAPGVTAAGSFLWPRARVQVRFDHWFARTISAAGSGDAAADISMTTVGARGCVAPRVGIVDFPVCAGVLGGRMRGIGRGLAVTSDARLPFVGADIGAAVGLAPYRMRGVVAFVLTVDLVVPFVRPGFEVDDLGTVSRIFPVVGRATAGIEVRLPALRTGRWGKSP